jgi:tRNA A37 threonylcarbamoyladenosine dehydratase
VNRPDALWNAEHPEWELRFAGIRRLYGAADALKISQAKILVVGIGGVGTWVAEALARTGVGTLGLLDLDEICVSNTNRQIHALEGFAGRSKVRVMSQRIQDIHPGLYAVEIEDWISPENCGEHLAGWDVVVDCIDSPKSKAAMIAWCRDHQIPIVMVGGAGGQLDPSRIRWSDLVQVVQDPLSSSVRSLLRRDYGFPKGGKNKLKVMTVWSDEPLRYPWADGTVCLQKPDSNEGPRALDCSNGFGALTMVTGTFGMMAASQAIQSLVSKPSS